MNIKRIVNKIKATNTRRKLLKKNLFEWVWRLIWARVTRITHYTYHRTRVNIVVLVANMLSLFYVRKKQLPSKITFLFLVAVRADQGMFPLGPGYISTILKNMGHDVFFVNGAVCDSEKALDALFIKSLRQYKPDCVLLSGYYVDFFRIKFLASLCRVVHKKALIIAGGPLISAQPELILNTIQSIDIGCIGDGEITIHELICALQNNTPLVTINGIIFRDKRNLIKTGRFKFEKDINVLPQIDYSGLSFDICLKKQSLQLDEAYKESAFLTKPPNKPQRSAIIEAARGCPFSCTFCYHPNAKKYRQFSLDRIFKEIDFLVERYSVNYLAISDDLFSYSRERVFEFCERIAPYNLEWFCQMRVDILDENLLYTMKKSGLQFLSLGIESAHDEILSSLRKNITVEQITNTLNITRKHRISAKGNLIFGDKNETYETALGSISWLFSHPYYQIDMLPIFYLPNSELYRYAVQNRIIVDELKYLEKVTSGYGSTIINASKMSDDEFETILHIVATFMIYPSYLQSVTMEKFTKVTHPLHNDAYELFYACPYCFQSNSAYVTQKAKINSFLLSTICTCCAARFAVDIKEYLAKTSPHYNNEMFETSILAVQKEQEKLLQRINDVAPIKVVPHPQMVDF